MNLNPFEKIKFPFESKGTITKNNYQGIFTIKPILNLMDWINIENKKRELLNHPKNDESIEPTVEGAANILATLKAYIIEAPQWYTETDGLTQCFDANIPSELYAKLQEEAQKWLSSIKQEGEKARKSIVSE